MLLTKKIEELEIPLSEFKRILIGRFYSLFRECEECHYWIYEDDIFIDHPTYNNAIVCMSKGKLYLVSFEFSGDTYTFAPENEWVEVYRTYLPVQQNDPSTSDSDVPDEEDSGNDEMATQEREFSTSVDAMVQEIIQREDGAGGLTMDIIPIQPGFGNTRDNRYYSASVLEQESPKFERIRMYATNHNLDEAHVWNWVSTITESGKRFRDDGSPISRVHVHVREFADRIRSLDSAGLLDLLQCSIRGRALMRPGFEKDGRSGFEVLEFTDIKAFDWVDSAGAGGHALAGTVNERGTQMTDKNDVKKQEKTDEVIEQDLDVTSQPVVLSVQEMETMIKPLIPDAVKERMLTREFTDKGKFFEALAEEVAYYNQITAAGTSVKPFEFTDEKTDDVQEVANNISNIPTTEEVRERVNNVFATIR